MAAISLVGQQQTKVFANVYKTNESWKQGRDLHFYMHVLAMVRAKHVSLTRQYFVEVQKRQRLVEFHCWAYFYIESVFYVNFMVIFY